MRPLLALLVFALPLAAAPVPKAIKARPVTLDGVWQCVEFNGWDGRMKSPDTVGTYWRIAGDKMSRARKTTAELAAADALEFTLRARDEADPRLREYVVGANAAPYSTVFERDGDTLRWAWCTDPKATITACQPAADVYYYVFKRVDEK